MPLDKLKKSLENKIPENNPQTDLISGKPKNEPPASVMRADGPEIQEGVEKMKNLWRMEPAVRHIMRRSAALADQLTEQDVQDDARVIREAANATIIAYDPHLKKHVERPDHKTRLAATTLRRAYHEGLPVKREISVQANFESGESVIERIKASPEAMRMLGRMSVQKSPSIFEAEITGEPEPEK
jgi:hypothetical protein